MPSSRPNPRTGEWERDSEQCVPDAALVAIKIRRKLDDCEIERSMSSGRIGVSRYVDDGVERAAVWLELGQTAGDDHA